jgi:hypothetical protein
MFQALLTFRFCKIQKRVTPSVVPSTSANQSFTSGVRPGTKA